MAAKRTQRSYDHRLLRLVRDTGDASIATRIGVPRSTASGWLRRPLPEVTTALHLEEPAALLHLRIAKLEARVARLAGTLRIMFALLRVLSPDLAHVRIGAEDKRRLLHAVERSRRGRGVHRILRVVGLTSARLRVWRNSARECELLDQPSCHQLDSEAKVRGLVEFYVAEHNGRVPHSAFKGQTLDEMYFGWGEEIPAELEVARHRARAARLEANRARRCAACG